MRKRCWEISIYSQMLREWHCYHIVNAFLLMVVLIGERGKRWSGFCLEYLKTTISSPKLRYIHICMYKNLLSKLLLQTSPQRAKEKASLLQHQLALSLYIYIFWMTEGVLNIFLYWRWLSFVTLATRRWFKVINGLWRRQGSLALSCFYSKGQNQMMAVAKGNFGEISQILYIPTYTLST